MKKSNFYKNKNSKGITLVALVLTIIILVILAGVSVNIVIGEKRNNAKSKRTKNYSN